MRIIEKDLMEKMTIQELLDKSVRKIDHNVSRSSGEAVFTFTIPANTPKINEYDETFIFKVKFTRAMDLETIINRPDLLPTSNTRIRYKGVTLTFINSVTGMAEIGGKEGYMTKRLGYPEDTVFSAFTVFGTIARILLEYLIIVPSTVVQGITFKTAHEGLVRPYIVLCKEAERKGGLVWANPNSVSRNSSSGSFVLLSRSVISNILTALNKGEGN